MRLKDSVCCSCRAMIDAGLAPPRLGIILGSGLGGLAEGWLQSSRSVSGTELPGFPPVQVSGQTDVITSGFLGQVPVLLFGGRKHLYEQVPVQEVIYPVLVLKEMQAEGVVLTNAAGAVNPSFRVGQIMGILDHIDSSFGGFSIPLRKALSAYAGETEEGRGKNGLPSFRQHTPYDQDWLRIAGNIGRALDLDLVFGTYCMNRGPFYETPLEVSACRHWGADAVGMSTVPEALSASELGLKVLGLSVLTNMATGLAHRPHTHENVKQEAARGAEQMKCLLEAFVNGLASA